MTYTDVDSSMIDRVGYDAEEKTLEVRFLNSGESYQYFDVPKEVFEELLAAPSKGSFMHGCIFDCYDYSKVKRRKQGRWI